MNISKVAKATGGVDATVALGLSLIPGWFLLPGLFLISAFIATAMGTSMGTIGAVAPVALGVAQAAGIDIPTLCHHPESTRRLRLQCATHETRADDPARRPARAGIRSRSKRTAFSRGPVLGMAGPENRLVSIGGEWCARRRGQQQGWRQGSHDHHLCQARSRDEVENRGRRKRG